MTPERLEELAVDLERAPMHPIAGLMVDWARTERTEAAAALRDFARVVQVLEQLRGGRWLMVYRYTEGAAAVLHWPGPDGSECRATGSSPLDALLALADRLGASA